MDFSLFAHMERVDGTDSHETLYSDFIDLCKMADQGGMRAIWTGEHHGMDFTIAPNPFLSLVDIAHHTQNVRLGTGTVIAPFWHPIALAGEAAATDLMTKGRLEIGIARGAYSYEYERIMPGMDAWEAGQRMRETAPALRKLWQGDYAHEGEFFQFPQPHLPPNLFRKMAHRFGLPRAIQTVMSSPLPMISMFRSRLCGRAWTKSHH